MPTEVRGIYFYLYLYVDLFTRRIVGWQVYDCESAELASGLLQAICERQGITPNQLTVHLDNGSPMKGERCSPPCSAWAWLRLAADRR